MGLLGWSVQKPRKGNGRRDPTPRRNWGRGSFSGTKASTQGNRFMRKRKVRVDAPTVYDEYSVFAFKFEDVDNWRTFDEDYMRMVILDIRVEIEGQVKAIVGHARLPVNFESSLGAGESIQILDTKRSETGIAFCRGMGEGDIGEYKDLLSGDNTLNGVRSRKYVEGEPRDPLRLYGSRSFNRIRSHAKRLGNLQGKEGICCGFIAFKNEQGASFRVISVERIVYAKSKCE